MVNKPYRLPLLDYSRKYMSDEDYTLLMVDCWTMTEFPHQNGVRKMIKMWKKTDSQLLYSDEEEGDVEDKKDFDNLPDNFPIFRGIQTSKAVKRGLSWTTDIKVAKWFAKRWKKGKVYQARINKKDVFYYTNQRNEKEVVINPYTLKDFKEVSK